MPDCDACGLSLNGSVNFCPRCGQPQNEAAKQRLDDYVERQAAIDTETAGDQGTALADRASYVVGYVAVVVGFAVASDVRTVLFVLAGVSILPPVGRLASRVVGRSIGLRLRAVVFTLLLAAGVGAGQLI